jgi:outer membrane receptor protein involved in Fe transport
VNDPFGGWLYWSRIPLESIDQIEILRGGGSNVWGNYALGGVINITTRGVGENQVAAAAEVGNLNDVETDFFASRRSERVGWSLAGNYYQTDGYEIVREDQRGPIDIEAFSEHLNLNARLEYDIASQGRMFFQATYFDEDRGNGTPLTNNGSDAAGFTAGSDFTTEGGSDWRIILFARDQSFNSTFSAQAADRQSEAPALDQFAVDSTDIGGSVQWSKFLAGKHLLTAGLDARWIDGRTNENFFWDGQTFLRQRRAGGDQQLTGVFVQDLFSVSETLQITLSARGDIWENTDGFRLETVRADGSVLRSETFEDRDDSAFSPKVAALYKATDHVSIRGSLYQSFRAPTINELYRPFRVRNDITAANADLESETLTGAEVGVEYSESRLRGRATAFWNRVDSPIANVTLNNAETAGVIIPCGFVPAGGSCRQRQNLGETRIAGIEAEIAVGFARFWDVSASYLYSNGEVIDAPAQPALEGKRIAQVPEDQLVLGLVYDNPRLFGARLQARYLGEQYEDDLNERSLDSYYVVDLSAWRRLKGNFDVFLGVENLFDETYEVGMSGAGLVTIGAPFRIHGGFRWKLQTSGGRGSR